MTAAEAVVFEPLASKRTETRNGPKKLFVTAPITASAFATSEPPTKIADERRSVRPRVKRRPWTRSRTAPGVTPPWRKRWDTPASTATTPSKTLGCGSTSSWRRIVGLVGASGMGGEACTGTTPHPALPHKEGRFCLVPSPLVGEG